jgi:hypothetical protein
MRYGPHLAIQGRKKISGQIAFAIPMFGHRVQVAPLVLCRTIAGQPRRRLSVLVSHAMRLNHHPLDTTIVGRSNKPAQLNAGSRPVSVASPASETPSLLGPRG